MRRKHRIWQHLPVFPIFSERSCHYATSGDGAEIVEYRNQRQGKAIPSDGFGRAGMPDSCEFYSLIFIGKLFLVA
jgi:hypothetical protein